MNNDYPYTPLYYAGLTKVKYYDWKDKQYHIGQGYHDIIICDTAKIESIEFMIRMAESQGIFWDDAIIELA
jgi:hypothetical protein